MAGVATVWATPARPERHFTDDELDDSARYHRPLRRMAVAGLVARVVLLGLGAVVGGELAGRPGWSTAPMWFRTGVGVGVVVVALRVPAVTVDAWFEYRHQTLLDGHRPVPARWFAGVAAGLSVAAVVAGTLVAWPVYRMASADGRWPFVVALLIVVVVGLYAVAERPVRSRFSGSEEALDLHPEDDRPEDGRTPRRATGEGDVVSASELVELARRVVPGAQLHRRPASSRQGGPEPWQPAVLDGPNAYATGFGPNRRVVVADSLLAEPPAAARFVVAHELTHLARRHVAVQTGLTVAVLVGGVFGMAALAGREWPWRWFGVDARDPAGLPVVALVILAGAAAVGPFIGWVSRAHERSADRGAIEATGALPGELARRLHVTSVADLDPPWWVRLYAQHPPPAERLEFLARFRTDR